MKKEFQISVMVFAVFAFTVLLISNSVNAWASTSPDLRAFPLSDTSVLLEWVSPGSPPAVSYDIRYTTLWISQMGSGPGHWNDLLSNVSGEPLPDPVVGTIQTMVVTGLNPDTVYTFAITAYDSSGGMLWYPANGIPSLEQALVRTFETGKSPPAVAVQHPRVLINSATLSSLRQDFLNPGGSKYTFFWGNWTLGAKTPWSQMGFKFQNDPYNCAPGGHVYVNNLTCLKYQRMQQQALVYLLLKDSNATEAQKFADGAIIYLDKVFAGNISDAYINPSTSTLSPGGTDHSGESYDGLVRLALFYDWANPAINDSDKAILRAKMKKIMDGSVRWSMQAGTLNNYKLGTLAATGIAALSMLGEDAGDQEVPAQDYLNYVYSWQDDINRGLAQLNESWHEGYCYSASASLYYLDYLAAVKTSTGYDAFQNIDFYRKNGYWYLYSLRPDNTWDRFADCFNAFPSASQWFSRPTSSPEFAFLASEYQDPTVQWFYRNKMSNTAAKPSNPNWGVKDLLWYDSSLTETPPSSLPLSRFFSYGQVFMRSDWSDNATWISARAKDWYGAHVHFNEGSFAIYRKGGLAIDSGVYDGWQPFPNHQYNYIMRAIASNDLLVYDPAEPNINPPDGGQRQTFGDPSTYEEWQTRYNYTNYSSYGSGGNLSLHRSDWKAYEYDASRGYTYFYMDITKAYQSYKISSDANHLNGVTREMVYLNPNYLIVFDKVNATNPAFAKKWLLHSINVPSIYSGGTQTTPPTGINSYANPDYATIQQGSGKLFSKTLLPSNYVATVVGGPGYFNTTSKNYQYNSSGYEFYYNGVNYYPTNPKKMPGLVQEPGAWRIEVQPTTAQNYDTFLNVLYPTDNTVSSMPTTQLINSIDGKMSGAFVDNNIVLFSNGVPVSSTSYSVDGVGVSKHLIVDLLPNRIYYIYDNGAPVYTMTSSPQGTLYFTITLGSQHTITVTTTATNICSDGTAYGTCSITKPKYCDNGNLIDACSSHSCGCPTGQTCDTVSQACVDTTPPVISNVKNDTVTSSSAIILWNTDESSTSVVYYGTAVSLGMQQSDTGLVTSHGIQLTSLSPSRLYYYQVSSCDASGNCANSSLYNFNTAAQVLPCTLTSASITTNCASGASSDCEPGETISMTGTYTGDCSAVNFFQIDAKSADNLCAVEYSTGNMSGISSTTTPTTGTVTGTWTVPSSIPSFCLNKQISTTWAGLWNGLPGIGTWITSTTATGSFKFYSAPPVDTTPPVISNVKNGTVTNSSAIILWDTDEASTSVVYYGQTTSLGQQKSDATSTLSHSITLTNLLNNTMYYYEASSCDASGNCANSSQYSFITKNTTLYSKLTGRGKVRKSTGSQVCYPECKITMTFIDSMNAQNTATDFNYTASDGSFSITLIPPNKFGPGYHTLKILVEKNNTRTTVQKRIYIG